MSTLKELREKKNLTQAQVAKKLGVDRTTVTAWETGKNIPPTVVLPKLVSIYKCSLPALLRAINVM